MMRMHLMIQFVEQKLRIMLPVSTRLSRALVVVLFRGRNRGCSIFGCKWVESGDQSQNDPTFRIALALFWILPLDKNRDADEKIETHQHAKSGHYFARNPQLLRVNFSPPTSVITSRFWQICNRWIIIWVLTGVQVLKVDRFKGHFEDLKLNTLQLYEKKAVFKNYKLKGSITKSI